MTLKYPRFLGDPWNRKCRRDRRISDAQFLRRFGGADNWRGKDKRQAQRHAKEFYVIEKANDFMLSPVDIASSTELRRAQ